jgi:anti-sigma-K factor RskA
MSDRDRLSDYLLGELSPEELARFEAELRTDPELAAEVERLRPTVARLTTLDPSAWELDAVDVPPLPPLETAPPAPARWWQRALVVRPAVAATVAVALVALGVAAGVLLGGDGDGDAGGREVTLAPVEPLGAGASGTASFTASGDRATVNVSGLPPSRDGEFYELWLLNSPDDLVSLGSFRVPASGEVEVSVPIPGDPGAFSALDISVEPPDGNPAHSSESVLRAPLATIS